MAGLSGFGGVGNILTLKGTNTNIVDLIPGQVQILSPAGPYAIRTGLYTTIQQFDPISGIWRTVGGGVNGGGAELIMSDGVNYRLANQTGSAVGALLTAAGSGYVTAPTVTASAGGSIWKAFVGGAVNTTVTVSNGGLGYTYPPLVQFSTPPVGGGIAATGFCSLTGGVVSSITVVDQGAGYTVAPTITFINDPREGVNGIAQGVNAAAIATLTGAGTVTGLVCLDHGQGTLTSVPTLAFSSGAAAATAIMCWSITAFAVSTAGAGLSGANFQLSALDIPSTTAAAYLNPSTQYGTTAYNLGLVRQRPANIIGTVTAGAITVTTPRYLDGGIYTTAPVAVVNANASVVTTAPVATVTMGGLNDRSYVMQL
ncbi:MAG: hypothetical protein KGL39_04945 [Patescibacteria group bacterium]|nr:hypothetical protein [Patescibacteria group bacterium]